MKQYAKLSRKNNAAEAATRVAAIPSEAVGASEAPGAAVHDFSRVSIRKPQAKLTVSQPGDVHENEAEAVANQVMRMGAGEVGKEEEEEVSRSSDPAASLEVQRVAPEEEEEVSRSPIDAAAPVIQRDVPQEDEEEVSRSSFATSSSALMQRFGEGEAHEDVSGIVDRGLSNGGAPLDTEIRAFMEPRFGHDFSNVRIHTGAEASQSAESVAARAYTVGNDIAFRSGEYSPGASEGKHLLAHELTHVVQQGAAPNMEQTDINTSVSTSAAQRQVLQREPPAFNSGAPANSPSYVNSQGPANPVLGGPTASAGDSAFVTGGGPQPGEFKAKAAAIRDTGQKLIKAEAAMEDIGSGKPAFLAASKDVKVIADGFISLADTIDRYADNSNNKEALEKAKEFSGKAGQLMSALEKVEKLKQSCEAFQELSKSKSAMEDKTNQESVEAWARGVGDAFNGLSNVVDQVGKDLPGFDAEYIKQLLALPKKVIEGFIMVMHAHYQELDDTVGILDSYTQQTSDATSDGKHGWKGELTGFFYSGFFQPKAADGTTLQDFMIANRKTLGINLWDVKSVEYGRGLLISLVVAYAPADIQPVWTEYFRTAKGGL